LGEALIEYTDLLGEPGDTIRLAGQLAKNKIIPEGTDVKALVEQAAIAVVKGWMAFLNHEPVPWLSPDLTPGVAAYFFVRAKYLGGSYPRYLSLCFTPEQLWTASGVNRKKRPLSEFLQVLADGDGPCARSLLWGIGAGDPVEGEQITLTKFMSLGGLAWHGSRLPSDFPALTAAELYDEFCPKGGMVLDPCHGWGGRAVGFYLSSNPAVYVGCDPSPTAHKGVSLLVDTLAPYSDKGADASLIVDSPFEQTDFDLDAFDFALTSPPYYDVERYGGELSSWRTYSNFDEWCAGFYMALFEKTYAYLKPGALFALNVGSQSYPLVERGKALAASVGFQFLHRRGHIVKRNGYHKTDEERGESLLIFRKP
jgi:hypothetical protein